MKNYNEEFIKFLEDFERPSYLYKWMEVSQMRYNHIKNQVTKLKPDTFKTFQKKRRKFLKLKEVIYSNGFTFDELYKIYRYHKESYFYFLNENDLPIEITKIFDARWKKK